MTKTRIGACATGLLALLVAPAALADGATEATGEIVRVEDRVMVLRTDDGATLRFEASPLLRIVTPSRHEIRWSGLRAGQQVRVIAEEVGSGRIPLARGIWVLREREDSSAHGTRRGSPSDAPRVAAGRDVTAFQLRFGTN